MGYTYLQTGAEKPVVIILLGMTCLLNKLFSYVLWWRTSKLKEGVKKKRKCIKKGNSTKAMKVTSEKNYINTCTPTYMDANMYTSVCMYILSSYIFFAFPVLIEEAIANVFLYFYNVSEKQKASDKPIYFTPDVDLFTHFLFWLFFWGFYQLKTFKFWLLRADYDFHRHISLESLREEFGVDYSRKSIFLKYHHIFGNSHKIFGFQLLALAAIITLMVVLRIWVSILAELLFSFWVFVLEFGFIVLISKQIRHVNDHFFLR
ncbi:hypothetical protein RFI_22700, partial [Reticulomyxa filosa]